jgi:hypothetical protein
MTRNDKIERAFQALKQAITAASVIVGGTDTPMQADANLSLNTMMDEAEYILREIAESKKQISELKDKPYEKAGSPT